MANTHSHRRASHTSHNGHPHHAHEKLSDFDLEKAKTQIAKTRAKLFQSAQQAQLKLHEMEKDLAAYVKKNPLKSVGYSILAGVAVAQVLRLVRKLI